MGLIHDLLEMHERKLEREAKQKEDYNPDNPEVKLEQAQTAGDQARTDLYKRTDPNKPRASKTQDDYAMEELGKMERAGIQLTPEQQKLYDRLIGLKPKSETQSTQQAQQPSLGFHPTNALMKYLTGDAQQPQQSQTKNVDKYKKMLSDIDQ